MNLLSFIQTFSKVQNLKSKSDQLSTQEPQGLVAICGFVLQLAPEDVPEYAKGGHMRGEDIRIYEQTRAEMVSHSPFP